MTVFGGTEDDVTWEDLNAWRLHARWSCGVHLLPGNHFFLQPSQEALLRITRRDLP